MSSSCSKRYICHRGAVALNNLGVSLLQKGRCRPAHQAFMNAIRVMKASDSDSVVLLNMAIHHRIGLATTALLHPTTMTDGMEKTPCSSPQEYLYAPGQPLALTERYPRTSGDFSCFPIIRIELEDYKEDEPTDLEMAMEAIILLHNMATTLLLVGQANGFRDAEKHVLYSFHLALRAVGNLLPPDAAISEVVLDDYCGLSEYMMNCLRLESLILQRICPMLKGLGLRVEAEANGKRLRCLGEFLAERDNVSLILSNLTASSLGAARAA